MNEQRLLKEPIALFHPGLASSRREARTNTSLLAEPQLPLSESRVHHLRGRRAVLSVQPILAALAGRCGQVGQADHLTHFLNTPDAVKKTPHLVLFGTDATQPTAAVLLLEYRALACGSRVYASEDSTGRRNVFAPAAERAQVAAAAVKALLRRGAQVVHLAFEIERPKSASELDAGRHQQIAASFVHRERGLKNFTWALREREYPSFLPLLGTYDETLAQIGQRTRSNLRYYRRRAEAELGCEFVVEPSLTLPELLAFNNESSFRVTTARAAWRYYSLSTVPGAFLRGIRDRDGRWLSLVGGRRGHGYAEIDWQMNRSSLPNASLSTVMRSYLIEYEIAQGSTRLYIEGGTPQPIGRSFVSEHVGELTAKRSSRFVQALERFGPRLLPEKNYLSQQLSSSELVWRTI